MGAAGASAARRATAPGETTCHDGHAAAHAALPRARIAAPRERGRRCEQDRNGRCRAVGTAEMLVIYRNLYTAMTILLLSLVQHSQLLPPLMNLYVIHNSQ